MDTEIEPLIQKIPADGAAAVSAEEVALLRQSSELVREVDTRFNGMIEVLRTPEGAYILAEQTLERQPVIRRVASPEHADEVIRSRLEIYDRMWDGCGCKVDFFGNVSCEI
jgi:hypothetical protein